MRQPDCGSIKRQHLEGLGRLIACDLIGMGDSGKLEASFPDRYT